jgi:hypothetical protein
MRLRQLFEALNDEVAIIFGRFNPPHKGHRAAWELASKSPHWYVGTNQSTQGPKDPLPYAVKVEAMKTVWPDVEGHIIAEQSWLTMASQVYSKHKDSTLLCLTDEDWVTKTIQQYNGKEGAHGYYNFKKIEQKSTPRLSSATALRDAVIKGDRDAFAMAAGVSADTEVAGRPFFDLVAEYLLPYQNAPKKVAKKKTVEPVENIDEGWKHNVAAAIIAMVAPVVAAQQPDQQINPNDSISIAKILKTAIMVYNAKNINQAGVEEELRNELKRWIHRQGDIYDRQPRLPLPDIGKSQTEPKEDAAGVGIVTKQNTTKDVNKGTLRKMLKAYKLI